MANQNFKVKKGLEVGTGVTISDGNINISGIITAQFKGDGSALTGVTAAGSGVVVQEEGSNVGTAATINFIGSSVTAALSGGIANVTVTGGGDVVSDTTPQLGGNLDLNSKDITGTGNISITGGFNATGVSTFQENVNFTSTASFGDNDKINVGTGNDLQIFHDGTSNIISDAVGAGISLVGNTKVVGVLTATSFTASENLNVAGVSTFQGNVNLGNNDKINLGAGDDLQIYHDGSNNYILGSSGNIILKNSSSNYLLANTATGAVELNYNNSKKLETTGVGVTVFGTTQTQQLNVTGVSTFHNDISIPGNRDILMGGAADDTSGALKIYNNSNRFFEIFSTSKEAYIRNTGSDANGINIHANATVVLGGGGTGSFSIQAASDGTAKLYGPGPLLKLQTTSTGVVITGVATATSFSGSGSALTGLTGASAGTYGASTNTPIITVDSNGRITGIATVATSGAGGGGGISNIVEDTTPQLGGNLDLNSKSITGTGNIEITGYAGVSGVSTFSGAVGFATHIHDAGTGGLDIRTNLLRIKNDADSETLATFAEDGAVSLYHNNALRLATTDTGVNITDNLNVAGVSTFTGNVILNANLDLQDNDKINLGNNDDLQISHDGTTSIISGMYHPIELRHQSEVHIKCVDDGAVELYHDNSKKLETTSSGVTVTGTLAATAVTGDGSGLTNLPAPGISTASSNVQVNFDVTANGSSAYRFTGPGNDAADDNPDLYLIRGQRYRFTNNSGGSHPFQIRSAAGGSAYSTGVTNNGGASGNIDFNVQHDAPSRLYYQCTSHSAMVGNIYITGGANWQTTSVNTSTAEEIFTLNNVGIGTDNPATILDARGNVQFGDGGGFDMNILGTRHQFSINGSEKLRIKSTGVVQIGDAGLGSDNGDRKLEVIGSGNGQAGLLIANNATSASGTCDISFAPSNKVTGAQIICEAQEDFSSGANRTADLTFQTRTDGTLSERLRITSTGEVQIANGNLKFSTAGSGIDFSATSDGSGTATSELLDDYEEGNWTPTYFGATTAGSYSLTSTQSKYTKIGNTVHLYAVSYTHLTLPTKRIV